MMDTTYVRSEEAVWGVIHTLLPGHSQSFPSQISRIGEPGATKVLEQLADVISRSDFFVKYGRKWPDDEKTRTALLGRNATPLDLSRAPLLTETIKSRKIGIASLLMPRENALSRDTAFLTVNGQPSKVYSTALATRYSFQVHGYGVESTQSRTFDLAPLQVDISIPLEWDGTAKAAVSVQREGRSRILPDETN